MCPQELQIKGGEFDSDKDKYDLYLTEIGTGPGISKGAEATQNKEELKGSDKNESKEEE